MLTWEYVQARGELGRSEHLVTLRAKVPGGWLVFVQETLSHNLSGLTLLPDPEHKWTP